MFSPSKKSRAVSLVFIFNGTLFGAWASRIPAIVEQFSISASQLSMVLFCLAAGAIASFPIAGKLTDSIGAARLSVITFIIYAFVFIGLGMSPNLFSLFAFVFLFGGLHGAMDVAMNTWAVEVESQRQQTLMPFFHAMFSLGAGVGAASGVLASWANVSVSLHFILLSILFLPCVLIVNCAVDGQPPSTKNNTKQSTFKLPSGHLIIVALVAFCCALSEGAMADWTAVYMHQAIKSSHEQAAAAYSIFAFMMFLTRLSGRKLIEHLGDVLVVRLSAISSIFGILLVLVTTQVYLAWLGFALLGIGYSIVMPLAFSKAAESSSSNKGSAIASIAMFAYGGMLLGPVLIGVIADEFTLKVAFLLFILLSMLVFSGAKSLGSDRKKTRN